MQGLTEDSVYLQYNVALYNKNLFQKTDTQMMQSLGWKHRNNDCTLNYGYTNPLFAAYILRFGKGSTPKIYGGGIKAN
jgi:hypothetical protein